RRGGRAVECTGLENRSRGNPIVGSNPTLSARQPLSSNGVPALAPPALRSLAREDETIVVSDAVVVRALVFDRQRFAIRRDDPMHGANDLPSLRERKVPRPGINGLCRQAVGV